MLLTNNVSAGIKAVLGACLGGDQPGQSCTLLTVLVLDEPPDLGVVGHPVILIRHLDNIADLKVHPLRRDMARQV